MDVDEFVHTTSAIAGKRRFTREEMGEIRQRLDLLHQKFVIYKQEAEEEANSPFIDAARKAAAYKGIGRATRQMSQEEWAREHGLRSSLQNLKPGSPKKKKKAV